jgi:hypothetical protein
MTDMAEVCDRVLLSPKGFRDFLKERITQPGQLQEPRDDTFWQQGEARVEDRLQHLVAGGSTIPP